MKKLIGYLIIINFFGFIICWYDKKMAIKNKRRISENFLFLISILGGVYGFMLGMYIWHHKTRKIKFRIFMPVLGLGWLIFILKVVRL